MQQQYTTNESYNKIKKYNIYIYIKQKNTIKQKPYIAKYD